MRIESLTQSRLKELLEYNPDTGVFIHLNPSSNRVKAGDKAGFLSNGYLVIGIDGRRYKAHRLAWLYIHGNFPKNQIDHINHNKIDNRVINLRDVTNSGNHRNLPLSKANTSGISGVCWDKVREKWTAQIALNMKSINLGIFNDKFEAVCARKSAENKYNFHKNHGS